MTKRKTASAPSSATHRVAAGDVAPDFTLPDDQDRPTSLSQFRGRTVVLFFYPKDNTPG
jgi:thioredoxin-dependent peroxiredoxin